MKGAVFIAFNQMIEDVMGIDQWEQLLHDVQPGSDGVYISVEEYPDAELFSMVAYLSEKTGTPVEVLVESFGHYLFSVLNKKYPIFSSQQEDFFDFVESIDGVIHREVRKLYDSPSLPSISCEREGQHILHVTYRSPRKLCFLAEGLIRGAARHYDVDYQLTHDTCMHKGSDHCLLTITRN